MKRVSGILLALVCIALAYLLLWEIPQQVRYAPRTPLDSTPADIKLAYENFELTPADRDIHLKGWWMPAQQPVATLLFLHGGSSNRDSRFFESLEFYRAMIDHGISVAAIDLRNHGDSDADGQGIQFGRTEQYDARALADWARHQQLPGPLIMMGISMGGATAIRAIAEGAQVDALILLDSLLHTQDALPRAVWANSGLPASLMAPAGWAATRWHGFPGGEQQPLQLAAQLQLPMLIIQDPEDPVILARYAAELAQKNSHSELWMAPTAQGKEPKLVSKGRWGSHVGAFVLFPQATVDHIVRFVQDQAKE